MIIQSMLDNDFYAFTMGQVIWQNHRDDVVSYRFINRQSESLVGVISASKLQRELDHFADLQFSETQLAYLRSLGLFENGYLEALRQPIRPQLRVGLVDGDYAITAEGLWWQMIFLETPVLAIVTELYQAALLKRDGISLAQAMAIGKAKLEYKIELLKANPGVTLAEFGSRRRFSRSWQRYVVRRLQQEVPTQLSGTSNVLLAKELGLTPIGTMAHQMDMCYAALEVDRGTPNPLAVAQQRVRADWQTTYQGKLNVYLTDTFSTRFAFQHFDATEATKWAGFRQDSGDPIAYGEDRLVWMAEQGLDPQDFFLLFSDGLNVAKAIKIYQHFAGRISSRFGIGTNLVNDLVHVGLNAVWKPEWINYLPVVKLSDEPGKFTGKPEVIAYYLEESGHPEKDTYLRQLSLATAA